MNWTFLRGPKPALLALMLLLAGATWWLTGVWQDHETQSEVDRTRQEVGVRLDGFVSDFGRSLAYVRSVPVLMAHALVARNTLSAPEATPAELNAYLGFIAKTMNVDLAFVIDASGLCIGSSNFAAPDIAGRRPFRRPGIFHRCQERPARRPVRGRTAAPTSQAYSIRHQYGKTAASSAPPW